MTEFVVKNGKKIAVGVIGGTVILFGLLLLFIPGPGVVVIAAGLAVLATEFVWARRMLSRVQKEGGNLVRNFRGKKNETEPKTTKHEAAPRQDHRPTHHP